MFQQMLDEYDAVLKMHCEREKQCIPAASVFIHAQCVEMIPHVAYTTRLSQHEQYCHKRCWHLPFQANRQLIATVIWA